MDDPSSVRLITHASFSTIDVCGFFFRDPPDFTPDRELARFLEAGPPPIYIGFGSIVIDDPKALTATLLEAVRSTGVRAIISRGWSNLGEDQVSDDNVLYLGDCPHEWLFQRVSVVIHHGGAGTTACGLLNGRPTVIVPFFGDQPFWGEMVAAARAGPAPIPQKQLNATNLAEAIRFCLGPEASNAAQRMATEMRTEAGVRRAVASFHANLPLENMRCDALPNVAAAWSLRGKGGKTIKLSKEAAGVIAAENKVKWNDLKRYVVPATRARTLTDTGVCFRDRYESKPIRIELRRWDPVTATASSLAATGAGMVTSAADIVVKPIQALSRSSAHAHDGAGSSKKDGRGGAAASRSPSLETKKSFSSADDEIYGRPAALELPEKPGEQRGSRAVAALAGGAAGVGGFFKHWTKGMYLDLPLAVSEGMRNAPRLYGGEVYDPGPVTDWKTGGAAAGKNFVHGLVEGIGGVVKNPVQGARRDGAAGAAKGAGVGLLNLGTKVASGVVGLVAFTGQGLYLSGRRAIHGATRKLIREASKNESEFAAAIGAGKGLRFDRREVVEAFDQLVRGQ